MKFAKLIRTPFFIEHLRWLLFEFQKTDTKKNLGLLYTNIAQSIAHTGVVYVAANLAIMLPGLLAYFRG